MKNLNEYLNLDLLKPEILSKSRDEINSNGYFLIEEAFNSDFCNELVNFISKKSSTSGAETNLTTQYSGTEFRYWDSEKENELILSTKEYFDTFYNKVFNQKFEAYTVLALKNIPINSNSLIKGRWHIDSFRTQYKVFIYLTEVKYENGPFEFFPDTISVWFKIEMAITGKYFALLDFFSRKNNRRYEKLRDSWIDKILYKRYRSKVITCKAGTILFANTSCVHRAVPCVKGERITLTCYY